MNRLLEPGKDGVIPRFINIVPVLTVFAFFILNVITPLTADDYFYAFIIGTTNRISSLKEIFFSMSRQYFFIGGRITAHFLVQFFMFIENKLIFDICNTLIYCGFVFLVQFHITGSFKRNPFLFFLINTVLWFFIPAWGENFLWLTGSCNYLWTITIILLFLVPYRKKNDNPGYKLNAALSVLFFFLGVLAGCTNENTGGAVFILLAAYIIKKIMKREKISFFEIAGCMGFLAGFIFLAAAPGNYTRLGTGFQTGVVNQGGFIVRIIKHFFYVTLMFVSNGGLFFSCISLWLGYNIIFVKKGKINFFTCIYFFAGIISAYSMIVSPQFPERAFLSVTVFLYIAALNIIFQTKPELPAFIKNHISVLILFLMILFLGSFLASGKNLMHIYLNNKQRVAWIMDQKEKGVKNIAVKAPVFYRDKHSALYSLNDINSDENGWPNIWIARFYEIDSIKGIDNNEPW
jgi:hypothetical protein